MSIIKSFSVGEGDMFYIKHNSDNFTIIDCCLIDERKEEIVEEIMNESKNKGIIRFISTHPDKDHILNIDYLDDEQTILNFYCVKNNIEKNNSDNSFKRYVDLRNSEKKAFYIYKNCSRNWMNNSTQERGSAGINILWPDTSNTDFNEALKNAEKSENPNNISPIIKYSLENGVTALWMGDLENELMEKIKDEVNFPKINILFAPHHGRDSGKVIKEWLAQMDPDIIVIGEAPSKDLNYYEGYNTITQNTAGDIIFVCESDSVHIYVTSENYSVDYLDDEDEDEFDNYIGTLKV